MNKSDIKLPPMSEVLGKRRLNRGNKRVTAAIATSPKRGRQKEGYIL